MHPFTADPAAAVGAWGEGGLLRRISRWLGPAGLPPPAGLGDDCAVLPARRAPRLVTVDPVIYGRHFDDQVSPRQAGAKLLKRNLSDIAAMGGRPVAAVVALILDRSTRQDWLEAFYRGLAACARQYGVPVVGGDIAQAGGVFAASLTLLGGAAGPRVLTRRGTRTGDWIYVTGRLGGALRTGHHYRFTPRLREGAWLARRAAVRSMMDLSDGLAKDLPALTPPGARPVIESAALPLNPGCDVAAGLGDGEDYELLFTLARSADRRDFARAWRRAFPRTRLTCLGRFAPASAPAPATALDLSRFHGYEHLR